VVSADSSHAVSTQVEEEARQYNTRFYHTCYSTFKRNRLQKGSGVKGGDLEVSRTYTDWLESRR
jgi:hypothetical protein